MHNHHRTIKRSKVRLRQGTIHYREVGSGEPLVFVHGFGAAGTLWDGVAEELAADHRCILPDWPLGSHPEAMDDGADQTVGGVVALVAEFLAELDLEDVTIVGNDSGGAISQILVTTRPERIARLVLTNSDCFESFPPGHFKLMFKLVGLPSVPTLFAAGLRLRTVRRNRLTYGALTAAPIDDELLESWTRPMVVDVGVRRDGLRFAASADPRLTLEAAERMRDLEIPVLLAWGDADTFFTLADAERLDALIPDSRLVAIPGGRTFVPLDNPTVVAGAVADFLADRPLGAGAAGAQSAPVS